MKLLLPQHTILFITQNVIQNIIRGFNKKWPGLLAYSALLLIVGLKFSFYLTDAQLTGWDTLGHGHMAATYWSFFQKGHSLGYDLNWFQGFPAFYYYPPFYYFLLSQIYLVCQGFTSFTFVFNSGIFLVILIFALAFFRLSSFLLRDLIDTNLAYIIALIGTLFYLTFPGSGHQGVSIAGIVQGTIVSTFGHSLSLLAFYYLERHRRSKRYMDLFKFILLVTLLFYSHLLSTMFFGLLLIIYILFFYREFKPFSWLWGLGLTFLLTLPGLFLFLQYRHLSSATAIIAYYPTFLSLIGKDWYNAIFQNGSCDLKSILDELIIRLRVINFLFILLFFASLYFTLKQKYRNQLISFCLAANFIFFIGTMDSTPAYLLPDLAIHWYRASELFFVLFTLLALFAFGYGLNQLKSFACRYLISGLLLCLLLIKFYGWDPVKHESLTSLKLTNHLRALVETKPLTDYLKRLEPASLILAEINHQNYLAGSPHWLDYLIQQTGHRNALGLMIESSLTPLVLHAYLPEKQKQFFVWGIDISWKNQLFQNVPVESEAYQLAFPDYIRRCGISQVIALSPAMKNYLNLFPVYFKSAFTSGNVQVFKVEGARSRISQSAIKPFGFLYSTNLQNQSASNTNNFKDFLLHANQVRISGGVHGKDIINLNPLYQANPTAFLRIYKKLVSGLIVYNDELPASLVNDSPPHFLKDWAAADYPLLLINFQNNPYLQENITYLYTNTTQWIQPNKIIATKIPENFISVKSAVIKPEQIGFTIESANRDLPVHLALSFFPDWQGKKGELIFQTDTNQMIVYAEGEKGELVFQQPLASLLTCWFYLLACLTVICWSVGLIKKTGRLVVN